MSYVKGTVEWFKNKAKRCEDTLLFLEEFLPKHIGESFTCADLRALAPGEHFDSHMAAYWMLERSWELGVKIEVGRTTIIYDPPIVVHDDWNGTDATITKKEVNLYTITGKRERG